MKKKKWMIKKMLLPVLCLFLMACQGKNASFDKAMELAEAGEYEKALPYYEEAVKDSHIEPEYYLGYGMALNHLAKYQEAGEIFDQILKSEKNISDGDKKQIYYGAAIAAYGQGDYESAQNYSEKALKIDTFETLDREIRYTETVALFLQGETGQAEKLCDRMLSEDDSDMEVYMLYGSIKKASGDTEGAIAIYEKAIGKEKSYYDAYFALYEEYEAEGQKNAAAELLDQVTRIDAKKASDMLAVGKAWYLKGEYDQALSCFTEAYQNKNKKGLYYIALTKREKGQLKDAENDFLSYISIDEDDLIPEVYNQLAGSYMERSRYKKAQSMLTRGIALGDTTAMQNLLRNQVVLYELQGNYENALEAAKAYLQIYSGDASMQKELMFIETRIQD